MLFWGVIFPNVLVLRDWSILRVHPHRAVKTQVVSSSQAQKPVQSRAACSYNQPTTTSSSLRSGLRVEADPCRAAASSSHDSLPRIRLASGRFALALFDLACMACIAWFSSMARAKKILFFFWAHSASHDVCRIADVLTQGLRNYSRA